MRDSDERQDACVTSGIMNSPGWQVTIEGSGFTVRNPGASFVETFWLRPMGGTGFTRS